MASGRKHAAKAWSFASNNGIAMNRHWTPWAAVCLCALLLAGGTTGAADAQENGPMQPPAPATSSPPPTATRPQPPPIPPEEMIRRFAANEDEILRAMIGYSFQQSLRIEEIGRDNKPAGQLEIITQQTPSTGGTMSAKVIHRSKSTLQYLQVEPGDLGTTYPTPLFPLITSQLPNYNIRYAGKQPLDELNAFIFEVSPRTLDRKHAYFSGTVWVEDHDYAIVKSIGKWVTETGDVKFSGLPFTIFETYRQQMAGNLWFPIYSRSDDYITVGNASVPVRLVIRWTHFTRGTGPAPASAPASGAPAPK
jgi:hypothetical protein